MMKYNFKCSIVALISILVLLGCNSQSQSKPTKSELSVNYIDIFSAKSSTNKITLSNPNGQQVLSGDYAEIKLVSGQVNPGAERALTQAFKNSDQIIFSWSDTWRANLGFSFNTPTDLTSYFKEGVIEFDIRVDSLEKGGVTLRRLCGDQCERKVQFVLPARAVQGQGWKTFSVPLKCFFHEADSRTPIQDIFSLDAGGTGALAVANIHLKSSGTSNLNCPDYLAQSVNAEPLQEWWALSWWMPRHEQKLVELKSRPIDLVFVGDSITEGWEKAGAPVWKKYFSQKNAIGLGYGGDRTENLLWRLLHGEMDGINPKLVVMMIGTNNTGHRFESPELIAKGISRDISEIRQRVPNAKILLLAIFPRDQKPTEAMRMNNERVNNIIQTYADNQKVFFLNINSVFLDEKGVLSKDIMPDLLHPNEKGYELWAKAVLPAIEKLMH